MLLDILEKQWAQWASESRLDLAFAPTCNWVLFTAFHRLWYSAPLASLRGENDPNRPSYVDGRDDCKHIISFASWALLQHHNGHFSTKDMDRTRQAVWGANGYMLHLQSATMENPEMPTHLGTQVLLSDSLSLFILSLFNYSLEIVPSPFVLDLSGCGFLQAGQICPE